jgi:hypothetical protein
MFSGNRTSRYKACAVGVAVLCMSRPGWADTVWQGTTGDWFDPTNWSVEIPTATDNADITNGGTAQISTGENAIDLSLTLGGPAGQSGSLSLTDGTLTSPTINVNYGGSFSMTGGAVSSAVFNLNGGTATFVTINLNSGMPVPVASVPAGVNAPAFNFSSGMLIGENADIESNAGVYFTEPANSVIEVQSLSVNANFFLTAGTLASGSEIVANQATFTQMCGTNSLNVTNENTGLILGYEPSSSSSYLLSGGSLDVTGSGNMLTGGEFVGFSGTGTFIQTGGTNTLSGVTGSPSDLFLGYVRKGPLGLSNSPGAGLTSPTGSNGTYILSGGTLALVGPGTEFIGYQGIGAFIQTGGTNSLASISGTSAMYIGYDGPGTYLLTGGEIDAQSGNKGISEDIGFDNTGTFTQTGGNNLVAELILGNNNSAQYKNADGTYNLQNGTLTTRVEVLALKGTGSFIQSGGTNTVGTLLFGNYNTGPGTYSMTGGILTVLTRIDFDSDYPPGMLNIGGGSATATTVNNAGIIRLSSSTGSNTYGALGVSGNYTQFSDGELDIGIGGDPSTGELGLLTIGGTAAMDGTLGVCFINGFTPTLGETFDFLTAGSISGQFATVDSPYALQVNYTSNDVSVTVVPEPAAIGILALSIGLLARRRSRGATPAMNAGMSR